VLDFGCAPQPVLMLDHIAGANGIPIDFHGLNFR